MTLKEKVHQHYLQVVNDKISILRQLPADLKESGANETKKALPGRSQYIIVTGIAKK